MSLLSDFIDTFRTYVAVIDTSTGHVDVFGFHRHVQFFSLGPGAFETQEEITYPAAEHHHLLLDQPVSFARREFHARRVRVSRASELESTSTST